MVLSDLQVCYLELLLGNPDYVSKLTRIYIRLEFEDAYRKTFNR